MQGLSIVGRLCRDGFFLYRLLRRLTCLRQCDMLIPSNRTMVIEKTISDTIQVMGMSISDSFKKQHPKEVIGGGKAAATVTDSARGEKPQYKVNGYIDKQQIHLGSYFLNSGDREECYLVFENNDWYLNRVAEWPVHRGASNGGQSTCKLDSGYLIANNIYELDDLLRQIYRGDIAPCLELLQAHKDVLALLDELVKSKTQPNYNADGLSLLWDFNAQHDGIIIHKCFSRDKDTIEVPDTIENYPVVAFGSRAFTDMNCHELKLPNALKELDGISGCKHIKDITIPAMTEKCCPFLGCDPLENIFVAEGNAFFCSIDGVLYTYDHTTLVRCPTRKRGLLRVSDRTKRLGSWACADCLFLTEVVLPKGLTEIEMYAFENCTRISALKLPNHVTEIGWGAFANMNRNQIICRKDTYAYDYLERNFSNPYWHGKYK